MEIKMEQDDNYWIENFTDALLELDEFDDNHNEYEQYLEYLNHLHPGYNDYLFHETAAPDNVDWIKVQADLDAQIAADIAEFKNNDRIIMFGKGSNKQNEILEEILRMDDEILAEYILEDEKKAKTADFDRAMKIVE